MRECGGQKRTKNGILPVTVDLLYNNTREIQKLTYCCVLRCRPTGSTREIVLHLLILISFVCVCFRDPFGLPLNYERFCIVSKVIPLCRGIAFSTTLCNSDRFVKVIALSPFVPCSCQMERSSLVSKLIR